MIDPGARPGARGDSFDRDTFDALRAMLMTMLGGAGGQLGRVPAVGEVGRAVVLLRESVALDVAATATHARAGVSFARTAGQTAAVAYALGRGAPRLIRAARRR